MADDMEQQPQQASNMYSGGGLRPVPDPTLLTTQQLNREISALKEIIVTRLDGMDKALVIFADNLNRVPSEVDIKVTAAKELIFERIQRLDEKFHATEVRFSERDTRFKEASEAVARATAQAALTSQSAVAAALDAAEKAVTKSEISTLKLIDTQALQIQAASRNHDTQIDDMKGRLIRLEEGRIGQKDAGTNAQTSYSNIVGMVGLIIGAMIGVGSLVLALTKAPALPPTPERVVIEQVPAPSPGLR